MVIMTIIYNFDNYRNREWKWFEAVFLQEELIEIYSAVTQPRNIF